MSIERSEVRAGGIVWVVVRDRRGFRKRRPAIILTPDDKIADDVPLVLMAITTTFSDPPPADHIELPWNADPRKVRTGLARRSAAVITWLDTVYLDEIEEVIGSVPPSRLREIYKRLDESADS